MARPGFRSTRSIPTNAPIGWRAPSTTSAHGSPSSAKVQSRSGLATSPTSRESRNSSMGVLASREDQRVWKPVALPKLPGGARDHRVSREPELGQLCHERMIRDLGDRCFAELIGFELQDAERRQRQPQERPDTVDRVETEVEALESRQPAGSAGRDDVEEAAGEADVVDGEVSQPERIEPVPEVRDLGLVQSAP